MDWIYGQIVGFLGNFFALMGNMGVELFELEWVSAIILFFSRLAWALFAVSVVVCAFECGIEYSTGRGNLQQCGMNIIKGFLAVSLFTVVPVRLYALSVSLQGTFSAGLTGYGRSIGEVGQDIITELNEIQTLSDVVNSSHFGLGIITSPIINQRSEGIDLDGVSGALMATQNLQMQTFITNPGSSQSGPQKQIAFAANQRDEVRDLHDVAGALQAQPGIKQQTFVAGLVTKGNGDCFLTPEKHAALLTGGGQAGQGYPCIFVAGFSAGAGASAGTIGYQEDVAPTLKGSPSGNCMPSILCINDQGGQIMECSENLTGTLRAQEHGHQPLILRPTGPRVYENHGIDGRYTGPHDVAPTMSARYGTGGNNIPLVQQEEVICIAGNAIDRQPQNGGNGFGWQRDISYTLTTSDRHSVYARQRVDQFRDDEIASTESARQHKDATDLVCQPSSTWDADCRNLIRRLTPLECERLQGYPDGWTDVPGASDSARYKALGNSVAIPCVEHLMQRVAMVITLGLEWEF